MADAATDERQPEGRTYRPTPSERVAELGMSALWLGGMCVLLVFAFQAASRAEFWGFLGFALVAALLGPVTLLEADSRLVLSDAGIHERTLFRRRCIKWESILSVRRDWPIRGAVGVFGTVADISYNPAKMADGDGILDRIWDRLLDVARKSARPEGATEAAPSDLDSVRYDGPRYSVRDTITRIRADIPNATPWRVHGRLSEIGKGNVWLSDVTKLMSPDAPPSEAAEAETRVQAVLDAARAHLREKRRKVRVTWQTPGKVTKASSRKFARRAPRMILRILLASAALVAVLLLLLVRYVPGLEIPWTSLAGAAAVIPLLILTLFLVAGNITEYRLLENGIERLELQSKHLHRWEDLRGFKVVEAKDVKGIPLLLLYSKNGRVTKMPLPRGEKAKGIVREVEKRIPYLHEESGQDVAGAS